MTKPIEIITRAMKDIGAVAAGEQPTPDEAKDGLEMLNDMLDQWSNENMMVYNYTEIIFPVVQGQTQYTIGPSGDIGSNFTGSVSGDILTITAVNSGAVTLNQTITGTGISSGTQIVSFITGAGGVDNAPGTYKLNRSMTAASTTITGFYQKPLSINSAFVRINTTANGQPILNGGLDYPIAILGLDEYEMIGLKTLNGPWPKALYYNPGDSLGNLFLWPNPSQGEMHLFTQTIFTRFEDINDELVFPQGYSMCLRWCLAERLLPMYGKTNQTQIAMINAYASQSKATLKRTNMAPAPVARYDEVITTSRSKDAGWILSGGFFR